LSLRYQSDDRIADTGLHEYEAGLFLPLWRPGQRSSARAVGATASTEADAATATLRYQVVGLLRTALWDIERATRARALAEDGVGLATELLRIVQRRYDAGELPMTDVLLARNALMRREALVIEADAALLDAGRAYRSLTGLGARPAVFAEPLSSLEDFDDSHPALQLASAELARARAELAMVDASGRGTPTLMIGPRREQAPFSTYSTDSLGISVTIPFGGGTQRDVQTAAAARRVAAAEAMRATLLRSLDLSLHEAQHTLVVVDASLELARQRAALAETHLELSQTAFAQGEMTLFELLQQQETARLARHEIAQLEVERSYAIAQINQALGESP
jgi:outer membrane protein TolC